MQRSITEHIIIETIRTYAFIKCEATNWFKIVSHKQLNVSMHTLLANI